MVKKLTIPLELKHDFIYRGYTSLMRGFLYVIREKFGAAAALECIDRLFKMEDRVKNLTNTLLTIFKLEGNDAETIADFLDIWHELCGHESTWLERSKTKVRFKVTKCPWKTIYKDISDWTLSWFNIVFNTINPNATLERPKGMCAGDSYCEYVIRIKE
jgi:hypothetical protein